jgi:hypothetical protein
MSEEYKTLRELNVRPGDVVQCCTGFSCIVASTESFVMKDQYGIRWVMNNSGWRIISRATRDDTAGDKPVLWRDMTDAEKGALLLAAYRGEVIDVWAAGVWCQKSHDGWDNQYAYHVRPETKIETVTLYVNGRIFNLDQSTHDTHRITFNLIDGKPDLNSIKMEEL